MVGTASPTDEPDERAIHARLISGDAAATSVVLLAFYPRLVRRLLRRHRLADPQLAEEAAERALLDYFEHPTKFDPAKGTLAGYLAMAAERDLLNLLDREKRRHAGVVSIEDVALGDLPRNNPWRRRSTVWPARNDWLTCAPGRARRCATRPTSGCCG